LWFRWLKHSEKNAARHVGGVHREMQSETAGFHRTKASLGVGLSVCFVKTVSDGRTARACARYERAHLVFHWH
jgi:hypothetical protein